MRRREDNSARARNGVRIREIAARAPTDLEALALLFEDDGIEDDGTVAGRTRALLDATGRKSIPGLQTALPFGDTGFAGDRRLGGAGFRDPWPASRNQPGHFLTAVGLRFAPELVSRPIPFLGTIRTMVGAPVAMSDEEVALRLSIGHEKLPDPPNSVEAALEIVAATALAARRVIGQDITPGERARRIAITLVTEAWGQFRGSLDTFKAQFQATTDGDIAAWRRALRKSGDAKAFNRRAVDERRSPLNAIGIANGEGNSIQDLRLTLVGWQLGELIAQGAFKRRQSIGPWLRRALG